jgi:glycosyltransferase involved in cell wall biosynthesis/GT2 family glycosyltransferase
VVICTRDRPDLLSRALDSVLAQVGPADEVVVVDDGVHPAALAPASGVRQVRTSGVGPAGARAAGLDAARGRYLAWCDDDDEWLPGHLDGLIAALEEDPGVALVYGDAEHDVDGQPEPASVPYSLDFEAYVLADWNYLPISAVAHRTDVARAVGGFDSSLTAFEDWDLWLRMLRTGHRLRRRAGVVTRQHWHDRNHAASPPASYWDDAQLVRARHHAAGQSPPQEFDPATWTRDRELLCRAVIRPNEGYGVVGTNLLLALARRGVAVSLAPESDQFPAQLEPLRRGAPGPGRMGLYYDYRKQPQELDCGRLVLYTMCESTGVPDSVLAAARSSAYVLVPCRQNADDFRTAFRAAGIDVPVGILHHGIDTAAFPLLERPYRDTFTFGTFGHLSPRKGTDVLIRAFLAEFGPADDVRLVLKSSLDARAYDVQDPRITVMSGGVGAAALLGLLGSFDALVLPSRGEGFGLCGLEAMATGLPVIATGWSGPAEYLDPADSLVLGYTLVDADGVESNRTRYFGQWAEPDVGHLRELMRWLYENRSQAAAMGRAASRRVHRDWTWDRVAADLERHLDAAAAAEPVDATCGTRIVEMR